MSALGQKAYDFVDERIGLKTLEAKMMNEPIKGGSRWAYVFGSVLLFIFIMQAITGILLMFYYIPSADHAYASTQYILNEVDYGWFILSYHFWGSSAMVVMVFIHMSQVFLCPCHLSIYDVTGKVLDGPAPRALDLLPIKVSATGDIEVIDIEYKAGTRQQDRIT